MASIEKAALPTYSKLCKLGETYILTKSTLVIQYAKTKSWEGIF